MNVQKNIFLERLKENKNKKRIKIHSFHRYYGKLIPAIPKTAIELYTKENDIVFDPFTGSGTTAVETINSSRKFLGVEINPLSCLIANAKLNTYNPLILNDIYNRLSNTLNKKISINIANIPWCINRDHWFELDVQKDLVQIKNAIDEIVKSINIDKYKTFLYATLSATIKQVSFADNTHIFPGVSKRMKNLIETGQLTYDAKKTFLSNLKKRISYVNEFNKKNDDFKIINGDSTKIDLNEWNNKIDLIVTNPPYISSVRYAETLKLELYWMAFCTTQKGFRELAESMTGSDYFRKMEYQEKKLTNYDSINKIINKIFSIDKKQAFVVFKYFSDMEKVILLSKKLLKKGKKLVIKIGNSKLKGITIPTGLLLSEIASSNSFNVNFIINDKINPNSRSLKTTRNYYSDIILEDNIIVLEKIDE